jgi:hypothetical protein
MGCNDVASDGSASIEFFPTFEAFLVDKADNLAQDESWDNSENMCSYDCS